MNDCVPAERAAEQQELASDSSLSTLFELVAFLTDAKMQVRLLAADGLASCCDSTSFVEACRGSPDLVELLTRQLIANIGGNSDELSRKCLSILINLSRLPVVCETLTSKTQVVRRVMEFVRDQQRKDAASELVTLGLMLLANLTRIEAGQYQLLGINSVKNNAVVTRPAALSELFIYFLLKQFIENPPVSKAENALTAEPTEYQRHLCMGYILVNVTGTAVGRKCVFCFGKTANDTVQMINRLSYQLIDKQVPVDKKTLIVGLFRHLSVDAVEFFNVLFSPSSLYLQSLCCLVYPRRGSPERRLKRCALPASGGFVNGDLQSSLPRLLPVDQQSDADTNDANATRKVDAFIDANSTGLVGLPDIRKSIFDIITTLLRSAPVIRDAMRDKEVYEVLRLWNLIEPTAEIAYGIEQIVHLLVYSEEELKEQDRIILEEQ